jgi:MFS family permease
LMKEKMTDQDPFLLQTQPQKLWTKNFMVIFLVNIAMFMSFHMLTPTFTFYIHSLGGSDQLAGLAAAAVSLASLLVRPFVGLILDQKGRKLIFIIGLIMLTVLAFSYNFVAIIALALILRFLHGIGWAIGTTGATANAADTILPKRFAEGMGFFAMAASISLAISPALGLWLIDSYGFPALFYCATAFAVASLILVSLFKFKKLEKPALETAALPVKKRRPKLINKAAISPTVVMTLLLIPYGAVMAFVAVFADYRSIPITGSYFLVMAVTTFISRLFSGRIADQKGEDLIVIAGLICCFLAIVGLITAHSLQIYILSAVFFGFGFGFAYSSLQSLAMRDAEFEERGSASSTFLMGFDVGIGMGGLVAGFLATRWGYNWIFPVMIIPTIAAIVFYFIFVRKAARQATAKRLRS